jgi:hypothetical protein
MDALCRFRPRVAFPFGHTSRLCGTRAGALFSFRQSSRITNRKDKKEQEPNMDANGADKTTEVIEKVKKVVDVGDTYVPTTLDYLCISGLMEISSFTVSLMVSPVIFALAGVSSFLAIKSALHSGKKSWVIVAAVFFIIDFVRLATTRAFVQQ